jgi:transposase
MTRWAWLATQSFKSAVMELMRIAWRTFGVDHRPGVGGHRDVARPVRRFAPTGTGEISYKRGHRYLTVVIDHDSGRLVWAIAGRDMASLQTVFDSSGAGTVCP